MQVANRTVEDAFVDWNVNCANSPDLWVQFDDQLDTKDFLPLTGEPTDNREIYVQWVEGAALGFQVGESFENRRTYTVEHEDGHEVTGTWTYDHTLRSELKAADEIQPVKCRVVNRGQTPVLSVETAIEIVARFLNEDRSNTGTSYWDWKRDNHDWRKAVANREQVTPYLDAYVVLQEDDIGGPIPQLLEDADITTVV